MSGMSTQWHLVAVGPGFQRTGLIYEALPVVEQRMGIKPDEGTFAAFQVLEREAADYLNSQD